MDDVSPISQKIIDDIGLLLRLISNIKVTRKRFLRTRHRRCNYSTQIPSVEIIAKAEVQIKALRELAIFVFKLQSVSRLPILSEMIHKKIADQLRNIQLMKNIFIYQAAIHDIKVSFKVG